MIEIVIDRVKLEGSVNLVEHGAIQRRGGDRECWRRARYAATWRPTRRCPRRRACGLRCKTSSGGTWGGCVYDTDAILKALKRT